MGIRATFAENLRRFRAERKISQEELADLAGVDRSYVSKMENERYAASIDMLETLAKQLGINPSDLLLTKSQRRKS
jgi:transcriptional regulator with XRE-family HTH domain